MEYNPYATQTREAEAFMKGQPDYVATISASRNEWLGGIAFSDDCVACTLYDEDKPYSKIRICPFPSTFNKTPVPFDGEESTERYHIAEFGKYSCKNRLFVVCQTNGFKGERPIYIKSFHVDALNCRMSKVLDSAYLEGADHLSWAPSMHVSNDKLFVMLTDGQMNWGRINVYSQENLKLLHVIKNPYQTEDDGVGYTTHRMNWAVSSCGTRIYMFRGDHKRIIKYDFDSVTGQWNISNYGQVNEKQYCLRAYRSDTKSIDDIAVLPDKSWYLRVNPKKEDTFSCLVVDLKNIPEVKNHPFGRFIKQYDEFPGRTSDQYAVVMDINGIKRVEQGVYLFKVV